MRRLKKRTARDRPGPDPHYPWDKLLDGSIWEVVPGVDFTCTLKSFREMIYRSAKQRGIEISTYIDKKGNLIIHPAEAEEALHE